MIVCEQLRKRYGSTAALDGLDLVVPGGVVYGLLGPNGAGKTTAVRVLATLVRPDGGRAEVAGFDVVTHATQVRARIGLVGQNVAVDEVLSGRQNLEMFGRLYHLGARGARRRADELLERFGLADTGGQPVKQYSGGMRRRLDLAVSFLIAPAVLFLDEPTIGLDPHNRNQVWGSIRALVDAGTTVLLTTQYLEEADQLAARISVVNSGRVIAAGSPRQLKSLMGGDRIDIVVRQVADLAAAGRLAHSRLGGEPDIDLDTRRISVPVNDPVTALTEIVHALRDEGIDAEDIAVRRPTLDEVFLHLTSHSTTPQLEATA
ncbi:MAG TPA: ATP-binding cassette domain-containing protein [Pseudonocardiaceae bacterium]